MSARPVGALACQMGPYLRRLRTRVISCSSSSSSSAASASSHLYDVVLEDSVLFPEGGGQPCDLGTIDNHPISSVVRIGDTCVIRTSHPFEIGQEVETEVDWPRRIDHMQHHTGQHLLTAIVEKELGLPTECWALTHPTCYIQLPTSGINDLDVRKVESLCNEFITKNTSVELRVFSSRKDVPASRSRGIPEDVSGPIRIIDIAEVDSCTCCGTHVENLGALRMMKLLHQEPKGKTCRLHFIVGDRVDKMFSEMYTRERSLIKELGTNAENILPSVVRRGKESTDGTKQLKRVYTELAALLAPQIVVTSASDANIFTFYREDVDMDFLAVIGEALVKSNPQLVALLGAGAKDVGGQFLLVGPSSEVARVSGVVCSALEGKGGQSKQGFRGKGNTKKWPQAVKALKEFTAVPGA